MASWQNDPVVSSGSSWQSDPVVKEAPRAPAPPKPAPKVMTREDAIKAEARKFVAANDRRRDERLTSGDRVSNQSLGDLVTGQQGSRGVLGTIEDLGDAAVAGAQNFLGIGPHVQAAISHFKDDVPYDDALTFWREVNDAQRNKSLTGDVVGSLVTGGAALKGTGLALKGVTKVAPAVGNFLTKTLTLQKGQKVGNTARIVASGATGGAAQAAGEGKDPVQGAVIGGITAPIIAGVLGAGGAAGRWVDDRLGGKISTVLSGSGANEARHLRDIVREDPEALAQRQADLSRRTRNNEPLIAATNVPDTRRVTEDLLQNSDAANEVAQRETAGYIRNMKDRMLQHVNRAGTMADGEPAMTTTVNDLVMLRKHTGDELMAPVRDELVDLTQIPLSDQSREALLRVGSGHPEVGNKIRKAFGNPRMPEGYSDIDPNNAADIGRNTTKGPVYITVQQADDLRQDLDKAAEVARDHPGQERHYSNASDALGGYVRGQYAQYGKMLDTYAAHSRMIEGFKATAAGKRISDIDLPLMDANLRTDEGKIGMRAGELYRLREAAGKSSSSAIRLGRELMDRGKLTNPASIDPAAGQPGTVTENIGSRAAADLADASEAQVGAVDKMLQAQKIDVNATGDADNVLNNPETLLYAAGVASGGTMAMTKARLAARLLSWLPRGMHPQVAQNITEMLFSSDPLKTQQALELLRRAGMTENDLRSLIVPLTSGARGGSEASPDQPLAQPAPVTTPAEQPQSSNEDVGFEDLASRVEQHESNGNQNAVSSSGAIGVMQVMPDTAPEAAKLAGVPFDEKRYKTDEDYNRQLGRAYLKEMLRKFKDPELALVAYNWGPGKLQRTLDAGKDWRTEAPQETLDYVQRVLG